MTCAYGKCGRTFVQKSIAQRFCCNQCRDRQYHGVTMPAPVRRAGRRLRCKWCSGKHVTAFCPNRAEAATVRRYGTVTADGRYVPPHGVKVRHVVISNMVHGDTVGEFLKEVKP